jgi:hypothetical protein
MGLLSRMKDNIGGLPGKASPKKGDRGMSAGEKGRRQKQNQPVTHIPCGDFEVGVLGTSYSQKMIRRLGGCSLFSLTPRNGYQKKEGWPAPGSVNVNVHGSRRTEKGNWLGYIIPGWKNISPNLLGMVEKGPVVVSGRVGYDASSDYPYTLTLLLPVQYRQQRPRK